MVFRGSSVNDAVLMLISSNLHKKSREVSIKTKSPPASFSFQGQATKHTTVSPPASFSFKGLATKHTTVKMVYCLTIVHHGYCSNFIQTNLCLMVILWSCQHNIKHSMWSTALCVHVCGCNSSWFVSFYHQRFNVLHEIINQKLINNSWT